MQVEFEVIARRLRRDIVEYVARDKHGPEGLRILRLLLDTGKMDEKQVSSVAYSNSSNRIHCSHRSQRSSCWPPRMSDHCWLHSQLIL